MYIHATMNLKGLVMNLSPSTRIILIIVELLWISSDQETYSQVAELGTEFIINIINKFWAKVLTTILPHYA